MRRTVSCADAETLSASSEIDAYASFLSMAVTVVPLVIGRLTNEMLTQVFDPFKLEKMKLHKFMPEG
jgi:hypothetical protein